MLSTMMRGQRDASFTSSGASMSTYDAFGRTWRPKYMTDRQIEAVAWRLAAIRTERQINKYNEKNG